MSIGFVHPLVSSIGFALVSSIGLVDALQIYRQALALGINTVPGVVFSADQKYKNCLRLNAGNVWHETLEQAVKTLGKLVRLAVNKQH